MKFLTSVLNAVLGKQENSKNKCCGGCKKPSSMDNSKEVDVKLNQVNFDKCDDEAPKARSKPKFEEKAVEDNFAKVSHKEIFAESKEEASNSKNEEESEDTSGVRPRFVF